MTASQQTSKRVVARPFERLCRHCGAEHSTRLTCEQAWRQRMDQHALAWAAYRQLHVLAQSTNSGTSEDA